MARMGEVPRAAAKAMVDDVICERMPLSDIGERRLADLAAGDRARAQRIALGTLRWLDRADRLLGPYLRRRPPDTVLNILRLACYELFVAGEAPHGVVDGAVALARRERRDAHLAGLVNAVLRRVSSEGAAPWEALPPPRLPKAFRKRLIAAYGRPAVEAMEAAHLAGAPTDLTPRDGDAAALAARIDGVALPTGSVRYKGPRALSDLPGYETGDWWVQDAAAALPARILAARPDERVLDMCAAPGGKTMQLAATGAAVTALEISDARIGRLRENLRRTGLPAEIVTGDARDWQGGPFDAVLVDAPCSASGTIRRHPDLPFVRDGSGLDGLVALQAQLIDRAVAMLAPGGRLVFCTCSLWPEEGEAHVDPALARHPALRPDPTAMDIAGIAPGWRTETGLRLRPDHWPEQGGLDGFFIAAFRKTAEAGIDP